MKNDCYCYGICERTLALTPCAHEIYRTMILDYRGVFYSTKTPKQLIDDACCECLNTYEGKKNAVKRVLNIHQKIPIPINPQKNIYVFPTSSPDNYDCIWIFANHIRHHEFLSKQETIIHFNNYEKLTVPVSIHVINQQRKNTSHCMFQLAIQDQFNVSVFEQSEVEAWGRLSDSSEVTRDMQILPM